MVKTVAVQISLFDLYLSDSVRNWLEDLALIFPRDLGVEGKQNVVPTPYNKQQAVQGSQGGGLFWNQLHMI